MGWGRRRAPLALGRVSAGALTAITDLRAEFPTLTCLQAEDVGFDDSVCQMGAETVHALRGVDVTVAANEYIAVMGPSGSGKSTLLRCINLLAIPDKGDIWIDGVRLPLSSGDRPQRRITDKKAVRLMRARLAMVFQDFNLWAHLTILENVMEAPVQVLGAGRAETRDKAEALLERVGIADKRDNYPSQLSGGQQQRRRVAHRRRDEGRPRALPADHPDLGDHLPGSGTDRVL